METDSEQPLPPPKEVARKLRSLAIQTVQSWQASYGTAYKKLALGYHFLKQVKKVRHVRQVQCWFHSGLGTVVTFFRKVCVEESILKSDY